MRNRALHDALRDFALEAAALLVRATEDGHELEFALEEQEGGGGTLYRYRSLTDEFIAERWEPLRRLPAFERAARALGTGARAYLCRRGEPGADAEPALCAMLERLYEESTSFAFPEERFEQVYAGVERSLYAGLLRATVAAPVGGVRLESGRIELADDMMLADRGLLTPAPSLPWSEDDEGRRKAAPVWLVLERDIAADAPLPLSEARLRFVTALSALRLLDAGAAALAPLGFARAGDGDWHAFRLDVGAAARAGDLVLGSDEAWELQRLFETLEEARWRGPLSWALDRFEMGLERPGEAEALSDHLLALRALLGGPGADPATIGLRLAALRAGDSERRGVQRRVEAAFTLEAFVIEGGLGAARGQRYVEAVGRHGPKALVRELEDHLRALLAGVLHRELDADLAAAADEQLLRGGESVESRAERLEEAPAGDGSEASDEPATGRPSREYEVPWEERVPRDEAARPSAAAWADEASEDVLGGENRCGAPVIALPRRKPRSGVDERARTEYEGPRERWQGEGWRGRAESGEARGGAADHAAWPELTLELDEEAERYSAPV